MRGRNKTIDMYQYLFSCKPTTSIVENPIAWVTLSALVAITLLVIALVLWKRKQLRISIPLFL